MKHQPTSGDSQRGFTLIELMITLVIAAILMAIGIPQFRNMTASSRLSSQTMDLIGATSLTRSEAIKRNGAVTLCRVAAVDSTTCAAGGPTLWTFWIIRSANGTIIKRDAINTFGSTMKVSSTFADDAVTFGSDGLGRNGTSVTGTLLSLDPANAATLFQVCTTRPQNSNNNSRQARVGASSRIDTRKHNTTC